MGVTEPAAEERWPRAAGLHYDYEVPAGEETLQGRLVSLVSDGARVLDLGCAAGALARPLAARGCAVTGVELDPVAAKHAEEVCTEVIVGDLDAMDLSFMLGERRFDVVVAGDLLEHLRDPARVLVGLRPHLAPGGYLLAIIPNVAHASVRLALLHGSFPYSELGLLDATHLRFFTLASFVETLERAGFTAVHVVRRHLPVRDSEVPLDAVPDNDHVDAIIAADPEATVYQYLVLAWPSDDLGTLPRLVQRLSAECDALTIAAAEAATVASAEREATHSARAELEEIHASKLWRVARIYRRGAERMRRLRSR